MSEEEKVDQVPAVEPEAEKTEPVEEVVANSNETEVKDEGMNPISIQAARFAHIEHLGKILDDGEVTEDELNDVALCKSQVLVELVGLIDYTSTLPANSPLRQAAGVLEKHLYKCYEKTDRLQAAARTRAIETRYLKDIKHELQGNPEEKAEQERKISALIFSDQSMMPANNVINLSGLGLTTGSIGMLSQFINSPSETLKAQIPNLLEEFVSKVTGDEKSQAGQFFNSLLKGLSALKGERAMTDALEGKNLAANLLSLVGGKGL